MAKDRRGTGRWTPRPVRRDDAAMDGLHLLGVVLVFVLAGGVKGITGMGLPTVAVSLLGLWMPPVQAAALLVAPSLATNVAQCRGGHGWRLATRLWPAWLGMTLATVWAPAFEPSWSGLDPHRLLGTVLVMYGLWGSWRPRLPDLSSQTAWAGWATAAAAGALTGVATAATGVFVLPLVPWLQALRLDRETLVQALGLSFTVATLAMAVRLRVSGDLVLLSPATALALAAAFIGLALGTALRRRIGAAAFQRALFIVFVGLGAANLLRGA